MLQTEMRSRRPETPKAGERWVAGARVAASRRAVPFPHDVAQLCLDPDLYEELQRTFPEPSLFRGDAEALDHRVLRIPSQRVLEEPAFAAKRFVQNHISQDFWARLVEEYGPSMRETILVSKLA